MATHNNIAVFILSAWFTLIRTADITISYTIAEEQEPPLYLGNVADKSNLSSLATPDELTNMRFTFLTPESTPYILSFNINENSGDLSTSKKLDRENLCPFKKSCFLQLRIGANSGTFFQPINVNVTLTDINDNKPEFEQSSIVLNISEGADINTTYPIIRAVDKDMGNQNSLQSYELLPDSGTFGLKFDNSLSGNIEVFVVLKQKLDREVLSRYQIYLVAKDGGQPQRSSILTINVTVTDINDNKPIFSRKQYDITVPEDISVNSKILNITARDDDSGQNGEVEYSLITSPSSDPQTFFSIDRKTGEISVINRLSHTQGTPLSLIVQASDKGDPQKTSEVVVTITVTDVNDNAPEININKLSSTSTASVAENSPNGTVVAYVGIVDKDTGVNGLVTCSLRDNIFRLSKLSSSTKTEYNVLVNMPLDREKDIEHVVTIDCRDGGTPFKETSASFIVQIRDENDNFPEFSPESYNASIVESEDSGVFILKVTASDRDEDANAQVTYKIDEDNRDKFYVDPNTGVVTSKVGFDRESKDQYQFKVLASDGGKLKSFTSTATVDLHILDANDETPVFNQSLYLFEIQENLPSNSYVGTLFASDKDIGDNGKVRYILPLKHNSVPFVVLPNGKIQTKKKLNREAKDVYEFEVQVLDYGVSSKNSTTKVQIVVLDINDNAPQMIYPLHSNSSIKVSHLTPANSVITKIEAHDPDSGRNGTLIYSIKSGNRATLFYIGNSSGKLFLSRSIQNGDIKDYLLMIEVSDNGTVPKTNSTTVRINIELTVSATTSEASIGQNVLIVITIVCVTIVLSLAIIVIIFLIRRVDNNRLLKGFPPSGKEEFQISETVQLNANKNSILTKETNIPNGYNTNTLTDKKEVSFSVDDHRDSGIFMIANSESGSPRPFQSLKQINESTSDPDSHEEELHRMASIRLHQKLLKSYKKPLLYHPDDNRQMWGKKFGEDTRSDFSEDITSDSGRGGSEEDVHHHQMCHRSGIVI